jgi:hypothetical protein
VQEGLAGVCNKKGFIIIITQDYTADKAIGPGEFLRCDKQTPEYYLWHPAGKPYPSGCPGPHPLRAERQ